MRPLLSVAAAAGIVSAFAPTPAPASVQPTGTEEPA